MAIHCSDIETLAQTYLDGELAEHDLSDFETHLAECDQCRAHVDDEVGFRRVLRRNLSAPAAPESLRDRIAASLDAEDVQRAEVARKRRWSWVLPGTASFAAAAALVLFVMQRTPEQHTKISTAAAAEVGTEAVKSHIRRPPVEVQGAAVNPWIRENFRPQVAIPRFRSRTVNLLGARLSRLRGRDAAQLFYKVRRGARLYDVQAHILDAKDLDLRAPARYRVAGMDMWVDKRFGYNIVKFKDHNGIAYVFTSDMDASELIKLLLRSDLLGNR
jgi:mycothiol system anti-sigma-R factor